MFYRRCLSVLLCAAILLCLFPTAVTAAAPEPILATLVTASDFQGGNAAYSKFSNMLQMVAASGHAVPDGILLGGDYGDEATVDSIVSAEKLMDSIHAVFGDYPRENTLIAQGNHDCESNALDATGLYSFDAYYVYTLNYDDFPDGQYWKSEAAALVQTSAAAISAALEPLARAGETRPIFVLTHVPLHHNRRASYGENLYAKYLFDVLNELGETLDIIFLFGHNHSGNYDDYIGGSVNYLAGGESIRIPIPNTYAQGEAGYTNETLNFTYANCGYVGYANNTTNDFSTNALTLGLWEIRPTTIRLLRYTASGIFSAHTIQRLQPSVKEPYVSLDGDLNAAVGTVTTLSASLGNIAEASYSWRVADPAVASVLPAGSQVQLICRSPGSTTLTLTVTDAWGVVASDSVQISVAPTVAQDPVATVIAEGRSADDRTMYFYNMEEGDHLHFGGEAQGFEGSGLSCSWESSDPEVALVENGLVTFCAPGNVEISFTVSDGITQRSSHLRLVSSAEPMPTFELLEEEGNLYGWSCGVRLTGWHTLLHSDGSSRCYYFDPATGYASDGVSIIDGHSYLFTDHVLTRGDLCRDDAGYLYYWAGELLKNKWFSVEGDTYFAMSSGYLATGIQWIRSLSGDGNSAYVFSEEGRLLKDHRGLYHIGEDTYYVIDGELAIEAGLVYAEGYYYFFPGSSKAVKNTGYWVYKTNGILPEGYYYFDFEGRMLDAPEIYHNITWVVEGESITRSYRSGELPDFGEIPKKSSTEEYAYSFVGWSPKCSIAIEDATYTAMFEAQPHRWQTTGELPTCTVAGYEIVSCTLCGYLLEKRTVPATGHSYSTATVPPTCTRGGYTSNHCDACGHSYTSNYRAPTGHINCYAVRKEATCTEKGSIAIYCTCGELLNMRGIKATGHRYIYQNNGIDHTRSCTKGCGSSIVESHNYIDGCCLCGAKESRGFVSRIPWVRVPRNGTILPPAPAAEREMLHFDTETEKNNENVFQYVK